MVALRKYKNRSASTSIRLPSDHLLVSKRLIFLLDAGDEELLEFIQRRFLDKP